MCINIFDVFSVVDTEQMSWWVQGKLKYGDKPVTEVRESTAAYRTGKVQGEFTAEDYFALPEGRRMELIDGVLYDVAAPGIVHQYIVGEIFDKKMKLDFQSICKGANFLEKEL